MIGAYAIDREDVPNERRFWTDWAARPGSPTCADKFVRLIFRLIDLEGKESKYAKALGIINQMRNLADAREEWTPEIKSIVYAFDVSTRTRDEIVLIAWGIDCGLGWKVVGP